MIIYGQLLPVLLTPVLLEILNLLKYLLVDIILVNRRIFGAGMRSAAMFFKAWIPGFSSYETVTLVRSLSSAFNISTSL